MNMEKSEWGLNNQLAEVVQRDGESVGCEEGRCGEVDVADTVFEWFEAASCLVRVGNETDTLDFGL